MLRKFLSSTAGASFNQELGNQTICVRKAAIKREESHARMNYPEHEQARPKVKDCVELIYKVKPSVYVVVSMLHVNDGEAMLFVNWAKYFDRLQNYPSSESKAKSHLSSAESREIVNEVNQQVQMPRIEKCCPALYAVMTGDDADGVYECECKPDGTMHHGFALKVELPKGLAILECITPEIFYKGRLLANKCLKMYAELYDNPPFPAWKDGLDEVWN